MKNSNLRGAGTVFRYTVQQHYKTPSVIIFLLILFVIAVAALPLMTLFSGEQKESTETGIRTLYIRNETEYPLDTAALFEDARYHDLKLQETDEDDEALNARLVKEPDAAAAVMKMEDEAYYFTISTRYAKDCEVSHGDAIALNNVLETVLHDSLMKALSITEAQEAIIQTNTISQVSKVSDFLSGAEETNATTHVMANVLYNYFIMIICMLAMSYIFQQCMEEKASKLVEMLMVSISPTALLLGKILAVTVFIFGGLALIAVGFVISFLITRQISDLTTIKEIAVKLLQFDPTSMNLNGGTVVLFVICILLVYAIFAFLSGIVGSCCSKAEDTQQASLVVVLFVLAGYLASSFAPMFESDAANIVFSIFPVTSVFSAFPNYVCGKIGMPILVLGLVIQALTAVLLIRIAGTVYKIMLLYRGGFPKPKQLVQMMKEYKASAKVNAGKEDSHAV